MDKLITRNTLLLQIALIIILGFSVYANSLNGEFIWDDEGLVENNAYIKHWSNLPKIFMEDIMGGYGEQSNSYRPLQIVTYILDYRLWKLNVVGYHLTNILLHILVALAIYWLTRILFDSWRISFLVSLLFVIHPIHTGAVAYISGRADPLAVVSMILCFILYIKYLNHKSINLFIVMPLVYILALLSRENTLILPALILLYHYSFKRKINVFAFVTISGIALIYILLRMTALKSLLSDISGTTTLFQRLPGFFVAINNYIRLLMLPFNLHVEYGKHLFKPTDHRVILGVLMAVFLLIYAYRERNRNVLISFSIYWFFIALLPFSNIYPISAYMAEHWLYMPSIGFSLLLANGLVSLYNIKRLRIIVTALILPTVSFYSFLTINQNLYWKKPILLYERNLKYTPESSRLLNNLGKAYYVAGKKGAVDLIKRAIEIKPDNASAYNNLATIYSKAGMEDEAITLLKKAIEIKPHFIKIYDNLSVIYNRIGKKEEALSLWRKAIVANPNSAEAYYNLGNAYDNIGEKTEAIESYQKAIGLNLHYIEAINNLASMYADNGDIDKAIELWNKIIKINPDFPTAHFNLAVFYYQQKQYDLAIKHCDRVIGLGYRVDPRFLKLLKPYRR